jgi:Glycosyl hydrolase family 12
MTRRLLTTVVALAVAAGFIPGAGPAAAATYPQICDKYGWTAVSGGTSIAQNSEWNDDIGQCITPQDGGYVYASGYHDKPTNGGPASYPSIYEGCHFGNCTSGSELPIQVSRLTSATTSADATLPTHGEWNFSYDLWFDANPNLTGQATGTEMMIWPAHSAKTVPFGSKVADTQIGDASWQVYVGRIDNGNGSWKIVSYVRSDPTRSVRLDLMPFMADAQQRGQIDPSHYLISAMAGQEVWQGNPVGSGVSNFQFTATHS